MFYNKTIRLMGNRFVLGISASQEKEAYEKIDLAISEISRIEQLLTTYSENSITNQVNTAAGINPVVVPQEFFHLVSRAQRISDLTQGAFDLSYGSLDKRFWNFDQTMQSLPDPKEAAKSVSLINYKNIILDNQNSTVFLKEKGMRIGFGGIGKGYAADKAASLLKNLGAENGIVNASGDLKTWGTREGKPWTISIAHPDSPKTPFSELQIGEMAVATSGTYEKYVEIGGKRYSHTIDPKTGFPIFGTKSVTVVCPVAELADAMATPLSVMGVKNSLNLIDQMENMACIIVDDQNVVYTSKNLRL